MSDETSTTSTEAASTPEAPKVKNKGGRKKGITSLTHSQKAEAVALWRTGKTTLDELSKRFKKRPETFSRMFKRMGIVKGSDTTAIAATAAKVAAKVEEAELNEVEESLKKLALVKENHFKMADALGKLAWQEIVRARTAGIDLSRLRETMQTLKLAGEVISNSRKELFEVLDWEELRKKKDLEDLPDLVVRELTQDEVGQLQDAVDEFETMDEGGPVDDPDLDGEI